MACSTKLASINSINRISIDGEVEGGSSTPPDCIINDSPGGSKPKSITALGKFMLRFKFTADVDEQEPSIIALGSATVTNVSKL